MQNVKPNLPKGLTSPGLVRKRMSLAPPDKNLSDFGRVNPGRPDPIRTYPEQLDLEKPNPVRTDLNQNLKEQLNNKWKVGQKTIFRFILASLITFSFGTAQAQSISGFVLNEKNEPVPFVNIYVRELESGTASDINGKYFLTMITGEYQLVISAVGYETKQLNIVIGDGPLKKNIYLKSSDIALDELVIKAKRKDPALEIIQLAIKNREKYMSSISSFKSEVYIKATEVIDEKERKKRAKANIVEASEDMESMNLFPDEKSEQARRFSKISLMEVQLTLNYQAPHQCKEQRTG